MNKDTIIHALKYAEKGDLEAMQDAYELIKALEVADSIEVDDKLVHNRENFDEAHRLIKKVRALSAAEIRKGNGELIELNRNCLLFDAPYDFDAFCRYIEYNREPEKQFYLPRRKQLLPIVGALQELADDKLDLLAISCPPGVGKTTTAIFYLCWIAGRNPELQNLTCSHNNEFLRGVYDECLRIIDPDGEYLWNKVFPKAHLSGTNAKSMRIDLGTRKRFETLEFTSKGSGNAGKVRATNLLYCDDLVEGIEQALSIEQMDKLFQIYTDDFRQRKQGSRTKELHIATRWSVHDVIGRLELIYSEDPRAKFLRFPALDENDESNFDYPYGLGFSTEFYHEQRNVMDDASWRALYMNEPIEREGQLYREDELRRYFELPDGEPDAILAVCDTKGTGSDYCVMPIVYQFGQDYYIEDVVCENYAPDVIEPRLISKLCEHNVQMARFESNAAGGKVAEKVQQEVKARGGRCKITTKWTQANKETKIIVNSPWVKNNCLFKAQINDKEYRTMLNFLCGYTMAGKNKHDDVPDAFAQLAEFTQTHITNTVVVAPRFF